MVVFFIIVYLFNAFVFIGWHGDFEDNKYFNKVLNNKKLTLLSFLIPIWLIIGSVMFIPVLFFPITLLILGTIDGIQAIRKK